MLQWFLVLSIMVSASGTLLASGVQPRDEDVLARVTSHASARDQIKTRQLRMMLTRDSKNLGAAAELGSWYLALAQQTGKAEYYGMAESAVAGWAGDTEVPADIRLIRSAVHRYEHEFKEGLAELDLYLKQDSTRADVLMTRSILLGVIGQYAAGISDCERISVLHADDLARLCRAQLAYFKGDFSAAISILEETQDQLNGNLLDWARELKAASLLNGGNPSEALALLEDMETRKILSPSGTLLLADTLIELSRWPAATVFLDRQPESIGIIVRQSIVEKKMNPAVTSGPRIAKMDRFIAALTPDDQKKHARELAWFYLVVHNDIKTAADFARINFSFQKEPIDTRLMVALASPDEKKLMLSELKKSGVLTGYVERPF